MKRLCRVQEKALAELRNLRIMLVRMKPYIVQCASQGKLLRLMAPKLYYMETAEMWSLSDLCKVSTHVPHHSNPL